MAGIDWTDASDVSLRFALRDGDGGAIVLIHEMGGSLESWDAVVAALPPDRPILRYDMRGCGLSAKIRGTIAMADMVGDLSALLDHVGWHGPVTLAGCAVGAAVALSFALAHPARVSCVVAMAPATGIAADRGDRARAYIERLERGELRALVDDGIDRTFPPQFRTDAAAFRAARGRLLANDPSSYAAIYRMLAGLRLEQELAAIRCPVTLVAGTFDTARPPHRVEALLDRLRDGRLVVLETGHVMPVLTPALVAGTIVDAATAGSAKLKGVCEKLD